MSSSPRPCRRTQPFEPGGGRATTGGRCHDNNAPRTITASHDCACLAWHASARIPLPQQSKPNTSATRHGLPLIAMQANASKAGLFWQSAPDAPKPTQEASSHRLPRCKQQWVTIKRPQQPVMAGTTPVITPQKKRRPAASGPVAILQYHSTHRPATTTTHATQPSPPPPLRRKNRPVTSRRSTRSHYGGTGSLPTPAQRHAHSPEAGAHRIWRPQGLHNAPQQTCDNRQGRCMPGAGEPHRSRQMLLDMRARSPT